MLVLNRKKGESIIIGDKIEIQIIDIQGDNIKLGIEAPKEISILRKELYEEIITTNREASQNLSEYKEILSQVKHYTADKIDENKE